MPSGLNGRRALIRFLQRIGAITSADAPDLEAASDAAFTALLERTSGLDAAGLVDRLVAELRIERFDPTTLDPVVATELPAEVARRHHVVLVRLSERTAHVAMANPLDLDALKDVELAVRRRTHALAATPAEIQAVIAAIYPPVEETAEPAPEPPAAAAAAAPTDDAVMTVVRACLDRIDELERRLERETLPPPPDPALSARLGSLDSAVQALRAALEAAQDASRDDLARIAADQDALVAALGAAQRQALDSQAEIVDSAVRRVGEVLLPRLDELAAGTLVATDRADRAQRMAEELALVVAELRASVAGAELVTPLREAVDALRLEQVARLVPVDEAVTALANEQAVYAAELARLGQQTEALQRRTDGWAAASDLRGLEAEVMALAAQLHRTTQGVEWARAGLAEARNEVGRARELAEGARRVAEAAVTATALDTVRESLDTRLRQVATQVARYEAGLGRLSGAQGDLEEAVARVRAVAEETRRLTGLMATVERMTAVETSLAMLRAESNRIASIVDAPAPGLFETACSWAWRGALDAWRAMRWMVAMVRP
jgi:hypothetical protein